MTTAAAIDAHVEGDVLRAFAASLGGPPWLVELRERALDRFAAMAWPTRQEEEWRRTDLAAIDFASYRPLEPSAPVAGAPDGPALPAASPPPGSSGRLRFAETRCREASLAPELRERGVRFLPFDRAVEEVPELVRRAFECGVRAIDNRLLAWHHGIACHGAILHVPAGVEIAEPFAIQFDFAEQKSVAAPYVAIVLEEGARATVIHTVATAPGRDILLDGVVSLRIGDGAQLDYVEIQRASPDALVFGHGNVTLGNDAALRSLAASFGGRIAKTRLECRLEGPGSEAYLRGIGVCRGSQHLDARTVQRHTAPHGMSRTFYRAAIKDRARAVYQGLIEVSPGAAKTDAYLSNKNLILNDGARADSIPSLQIKNNDVICTHGSTTGKLNESELFYLMARGIPRAGAERMLVMAFLETIAAHAPEPIREELRAQVEAAL